MTLDTLSLKISLKNFIHYKGKMSELKIFLYPDNMHLLVITFVMLFVLLIPFAILNFFVPNSDSEAIKWSVWLAVPMSVAVQWVFFTMEKIGDYSENPFEGIGNDVPITALSRTIEIDLRDMLDEKELPKPIESWNGAILT